MIECSNVSKKIKIHFIYHINPEKGLHRLSMQALAKKKPIVTT